MKILFFAHVQDSAGCGSMELFTAKPLNNEQLWSELLKKFPALAAHKKTVRLARNWEYAGEQMIFGDADEVALIPPVSGG